MFIILVLLMTFVTPYNHCSWRSGGDFVRLNYTVVDTTPLYTTYEYYVVRQTISGEVSKTETVSHQYKDFKTFHNYHHKKHDDDVGRDCCTCLYGVRNVKSC